MMEKLISVVVPIYKVEKYLPICLDSLLNQSYKNFELILVDDGSPDTCPKLCDNYSKIDPRIKVIHKNNGGLSDARNAGLSIANGEWITFVDSDDYVGSEFLKTLYDTAESNAADISICDYKVVFHDNEIEKNRENEVYVFDNVECLKKTYIPETHGMEFVAWGKLYKLKLFKEQKIKYPVGKIHEDTFTTYKLLYAARRIAFCGAVEYFYRQRESSIMTSSFSENRLVVLEATREACEFFQEKNETELLSLAVNAHFRNYVCSFGKIVNNKTNLNDYQVVKQKVLDDYRKDYRMYYKLSNYGIFKKLFYWMFYLFPNAYYMKLL